MSEILLAREKVIRFIKEYETWFLIAVKFIGMMFVFSYVNSSLGYYEALNSMMVNVFLALVCSIIPGTFIVFVVAAVVLAHLFKLSVILAVLTLVVMIIVYLLFLKFAPEQSVILLAVPVLAQLNLEFALPLIAGFLFTPYAVIPAVIGMFMLKFIGYVCDAVSLTGTGMSFNLDGVAGAVVSIADQISSDRTIWVYAVVCALTIAVVFVIGQFSFDYAWYVAILAGGIVEIVAAFFAGEMLKSTISLSAVIIGTVIGIIISVILQFFKCAVDYSRKEHLQFEDDEYYYYVKAIPKYMVAEKKKTDTASDTEA